MGWPDIPYTPDGSATAIPTGGAAPYTYEWSNGGMTQTIDNISGGTYAVTVTDASGCQVVSSGTVSEPPAINLSIDNVTNASCGASDGSITASVSGGSGPTYMFFLNGSIAGVGSPQTMSNLSPGTYTIAACDGNECFVDTTVVITGGAGFTVDVVTNDASCPSNATGDFLPNNPYMPDGNAEAVITGGTAPFTYAWSNGELTSSIFNLTAGTYTVTVTDANGCAVIASGVVNEPDPLILTIDDMTNVSCGGLADGIITVSVTGGNGPPYMYFLNGVFMGTTNVFTGLGGGSYTIAACDGTECFIDTTVVIIEEPSMTVEVTTEDASCHSSTSGTFLPNNPYTPDGSATVVILGGTTPYTYLWNNGETTETIMDLGAGIYSVTVTDANGCTVTADGLVNEPPALVLSIDSIQDVSCAGADDGFIIASVSGGAGPPYMFFFDGVLMGSTNVFDNLSAGTYTIAACDGVECFVETTVEIEEQNPFDLQADITDVSCNGDSDGSIDLTIIGGDAPYIIDWSNGATTEDISGLSAGNYTVWVTDASGCMINDVYEVTEPDELNINVMAMGSLCNPLVYLNTTVQGGTPPYTYLWNTLESTPQISTTTAGYYLVKVEDDNGCFAYGTIVLDDCEPKVTTGLAEEIVSTAIEVFPNPNSGDFVVSMTTTQPINGEIAVYNTIGELVHNRAFAQERGQFEERLSLTHLPSAIYWLRISIEGEIYNHRVFITR